MKNIVKYSCLISLAFILATLTFFGCRCSPSKPKADPLVGWKMESKEPSPKIEKDYQDYIQGLSPDEKKYIAYREFLKDGTGRRALKITIGLKGTDWEHILIYDRDDIRVRVIKYISGHSHS